MTIRTADEVLEAIRAAFPQKGSHAFRSLVVALDKIDWNKSRTVDKEQFQSALHTVGVTVTNQDLHTLFDTYNVNGQLPYDVILAQLRRGSSSARSRIIVDRAFESLDVNGIGEIDFAAIKRRFQAFEHPDVKSGVGDCGAGGKQLYAGHHPQPVQSVLR